MDFQPLLIEFFLNLLKAVFEAQSDTNSISIEVLTDLASLESTTSPVFSLLDHLMNNCSPYTSSLSTLLDSRLYPLLDQVLRNLLTQPPDLVLDHPQRHALHDKAELVSFLLVFSSETQQMVSKAYQKVQKSMGGEAEVGCGPREE